MVLSGAPEDEPHAATIDEPERVRGAAWTSGRLLPISAKSLSALSALAGAYRQLAVSTPDLDDLCWAAATQRDALEHRLAVTFGTREELIAGLAGFEQGDLPPTVATRRRVRGRNPRLVFVFPGQGSQWVGMGRELLATEPVFARSIAASEAAFAPHVDWSLRAELAADEQSSRLSEIDVVQPLLFAVCVGLAALWRSWGVEPAAVIGQSMGEVAAAHVAGALTLDDAARVICRRSRLLKSLAGRGAMALVELSMADALLAIEGREDRVSIAVASGPRTTVLSGDAATLDEIVAGLESRDVFCRRVKVDVASHSPQVDDLRDELRASLDGITSTRSDIPFYSTVTAGRADELPLDTFYWVRNLRDPVLFAPTVDQLVADGHRLFFELSPHPVLVPDISAVIGGQGAAVGSLRRAQSDLTSMRVAAGELWAAGYPLDWESILPSRRRAHPPLPLYPFQRQRHWLDATLPLDGAPPARGGRQETGHVLLGHHVESSATPGTHIFQTAIDLRLVPFLADHRIGETVIYPAAAYLEMVTAGTSAAFGAGSYRIEDVEFKRALVLAPDAPRVLQLVLTTQIDGSISFRVSSEDSAAGASQWTPCATGRVVRSHEQDGGPAVVALDPLRGPATEVISGDQHYDTMTRLGLSYGRAFRTVSQAWRGDGVALGRLELRPTAGVTANLTVHPAVLDGAFQLLAAAIPREIVDVADEDVWVPVGVREMRVFGDRPISWARAQTYPVDGGRLEGDVVLMDEDGSVVVDVRGLRVQRLDAVLSPGADDRTSWFYRPVWRELPAPPAIEAAAGTFVLLGDPGVAAALGDRLEHAGARWVSAPAAALYRRGRMDVEAAEAVLRTLLPDGPGAVRGMLVIAEGTVPAGVRLTGEEVSALQPQGCGMALLMVQALVRLGWSDLIPLWLVTVGAQAVLDDDQVDVAHAALWGFGRTLALELPEFRARCVDLSGLPEDIGLLCAVLVAPDRENQIALRGGRRFAARLERGLHGAGEREPVPVVDGEPSYRLRSTRPGVLDNLTLLPEPRRAPDPDEVEVVVKAAGLNFSDVMKALGIYPGAIDGELVLGGECAGVVTRVGDPLTTGLRPGDRVLTVASNALSSHVTVAARHARPIPQDWTFEEAATVPIAFLTAYYGLVHSARLAAGERVLIHAATGGVGLAAVQLAQLVGAEIFATAGNEVKRSYLHSLGIRHIMDSRSMDFAEEIMRTTDGEGVDVILNSLAGPGIPRGLAVLRPFGRFIEIGSRDIFQNTPLDLGLLARNITLTALNIDRGFRERSELMISLLDEIFQHIDAGRLRPLPTNIFPISEVTAGFHHMAQARHIGKVVFQMDDPHARVVGAVQAPRLRPETTTVITGGLGALGLHVAGSLIERGARRVDLIGRRGEEEVSERARTAIGALRATGADVVVHRADVADHAALGAVLAGIADDGATIGGVVHAAGILEDSLLLGMDWSQFELSLAPKLTGAWNLHSLTRHLPLDFFLMFSSAASVIGSPGQANYAAANAFLDALALHRRRQGLPAVTINWGPWTEGGLADTAERGGRLATRGLRSLTAAQALAAMAQVLTAGAEQSVVLPVDIRRSQRLLTAIGPIPLLDELVGSAIEDAADSEIRRELLALEPGPRRRALLEKHLLDQIAQVLRIPAEDIDSETPLHTLGFDSLMALELRNRLEASLGVTLSATLAWNYPTVADIAPHLGEKMGAPIDGAGRPGGTPDRIELPAVAEPATDLPESAAQ